MPPGYIYRMRRTEEWDWPPRRRRWWHYRTINGYQPSGWNSPGVKKAIDIYWRVIITTIKMLLAIPLSIMAIGAFWLLWTIITLAMTALLFPAATPSHKVRPERPQSYQYELERQRICGSDDKVCDKVLRCGQIAAERQARGERSLNPYDPEGYHECLYGPFQKSPPARGARKLALSAARGRRARRADSPSQEVDANTPMRGRGIETAST